MKHNRKIIYLAGFLFSMTLALVSYINSSFLENYVGKNYVGIIYIVASIITIVGLSEMPRILTRLGNRVTIMLFCFFIFISLVTLAFTNSALVAIIFFILYFISTGFVVASLDIFIEDFSKNSPIGGLRGLYLTVTNGAWIVAQVISGSIIAKSSFSGIYLFSASFMVLMFIVSNLFLNNFKDPEYKKFPILRTIKSFIKNKNISRIYFSNLFLQFFYAWMVIYSPIYLHEYIGFGWNKIGFIFAIMLIPFVVVDIPLGKLSDKIGEKKMLIVGFSIIAISVLVIPFIKEPALFIWAFALFATRIGAATIEIMNDSYFFKVTKEENAGEVSFFRNAPFVAYVIAPLLALPILLLVPSFKYIFFVLSAIMLIGLLNILKLKDVK